MLVQQTAEISQVAPFDPGAGALVDALARIGRGLDFSGYARSGLVRRLVKHVRESGFSDWDAYAAYLAEHEQEYERLSAAVLVHRTEFFRDPQAWLALGGHVLPALLAAKPSGEKLRVWCAGCATGQEAYSVAIALAEQLGPAAYRERVTVFGTDVSASVLEVARAGSYGAYAMQDVPAALRDKYFEASRTRGIWTARNKLRSRIVFGRHDLLRDPHLRQLDLIICRNTLMYFTPAARRRSLLRFCVGLRPHGVLFTGNTEIPQASVELFARSYGDQPLYHRAANADRRALPLLLRAMHERRVHRELTAPVP